MKRSLVMVFVLALMVSMVNAQEWTRSTDSDIEYNCEAVVAVLDAINNGEVDDDVTVLPFIRITGVELNVREYVGIVALTAFEGDVESALTMDRVFSNALDACTLQEAESDTAEVSQAAPEGSFTVIVNGGANLRSCAGTNCSIVRQAAAGEALTVIATEDDWYQVDLGGETAYIANFLVTRGPDAVIDIDETYLDANTGCGIAFNVKRGSADMNIILSGENASEIVVDLFRPNESNALKVQAQLDKTFIDTGDPYILQYYSWNIGWPTGMYQIELTYGGKTSRLAWEMVERADYNIYFMCGE